MGRFADMLGTLAQTFKIGHATLDASGLTAARTLALQDAAGTLALLGKAPYKLITSSYSVVAADAGKIIVDGTGSNQSTVTLDASLFASGNALTLVSYSTQGTLIGAASGTTLHAGRRLPFVRGSGGVVLAVFDPPDVYLTGDLAGANIVSQSLNLTIDSLSLSESGMQFTGSTAHTATLAADGTAPLPIGWDVWVEQAGTGIVTVAAQAGVTLNAPYGVATNGVGDRRYLQKTAANTWTVL